MALPADGQNANGLTKVTQIPAGKELMFIDPTTNEGGIITLEDLTKQILNGLTSQAFALDAGQMTLPAALNYLYGNLSKNLNGTTWYNGNNTSIFDILSPREGAGVYSIYSATDFPTTEGYGFIIKGCERMIFIDAKGLYYAVANRGEWVRSWSKL